MSMLHRETEELKDTRDEYRREIEKLEKRVSQLFIDQSFTHYIYSNFIIYNLYS